MTTCTVENRCVQPQGNSPESMCDGCEQREAEAREARIAELRAALHAFADQMPGRMYDEEVVRVVSAIVRAAGHQRFCRLHRNFGMCPENCAVEGLREAME